MFFIILIIINFLSISALICQNGQQTTYLFSPDVTLPYLFSSIVKKIGISVNDCKLACTLTASCGSVAYEENTKICTLKTKTVWTGSELVIQPGTNYYEKICISVNRTSTCSNGLLRLPQQFLVGFAKEVITTPRLEDCIAKCYQTMEPYEDYNCASLLYYYNDHTCILNAETIRNYPDLMTSTKPQEGRVDYLDNDCFQGWAQWTPWGTCFPNGTQIRQRLCAADNGICPGTPYDTQKCRQEEINPVPHTVTICPEARFYFGCNNYCQNFTKLGYSNYPDCLRGGGKPVRPVRSVDYFAWNRACNNYLSLGYNTYPECLRERMKL